MMKNVNCYIRQLKLKKLSEHYFVNRQISRLGHFTFCHLHLSQLYLSEVLDFKY